MEEHRGADVAHRLSLGELCFHVYKKEIINLARLHTSRCVCEP